MQIQQWWYRLTIPTKFTLAFGMFLALMIFIAATSYSAISIIQYEQEIVLATSSDIQRNVFRMDASLEKSRRLQRDFFLEYPVGGFEHARDSYGLAATAEISTMLTLNIALQQQVAQLNDNSLLRESLRDLTLYQSTAERYSAIFHETMLLVSRLVDPDTGLETQFLGVLEQLGETVQISTDSQVQALYDEMRTSSEYYLLTRERPRLQASINSATQLRTAIDQDASLSPTQKTVAEAHIATYQELSEDLVVLDEAIRRVSRDFEVQAETFDPITANLVEHTNQEVARVQNRIDMINQYAILALVISTLGALVLAAVIIRMLNRSITRNIVTLTDVTSTWQAGNRAVSVQIDSADELGQLAHSFNSMAVRINTMVDELEQRVAERTAELQTAFVEVEAARTEAEAANAQIRQMNADLEVRVAERTNELAQNQMLLQSIIDNLPAALTVRDTNNCYTLVNDSAVAWLGMERQQIIGAKTETVLSPERVEQWRQHDQQVTTTGHPVEVEEVHTGTNGTDGTTTYYHLVVFPIYDSAGSITALGGIATDITERKRAEATHAALQQQIIETQRNTVRELSTPLIPITDMVVIMPLIGAIDSQRAQQIMETLLDGVERQRATLAIVDITGVQVVDTQVADALIRAAQAVRLLGAQVMLTGIQPQIAQTLVQLGIDLSGIITRSSLQDGIVTALKEKKRK